MFVTALCSICYLDILLYMKYSLQVVLLDLTIISFQIKLFSPWYGWKIAELNNTHNNNPGRKLKTEQHIPQ